MIVVEFLKKDF